MSFALKPRRRVDRELRRVARKELQKAVKTLNTDRLPIEAVHESRKSLKKVRAILQLIDDDNGAGLGASEKRLQKIARTLSDVRDADAMVEIVDKLQRKTPRPFDQRAEQQLRGWIAEHRRQVRRKAAGKKTLKTADKELRAIRRKAKQWSPSHRAFGAVSRGLADTLRRGRKALRQATRRQRADDYHEWREELKALWCGLRLLEPAAPRIARDVHALHTAEAWLGDDHNIVTLCAALSDDRSPNASVLGGRLKAAADRYHTEARKKAVAAAKEIYNRKRRSYIRELKRAWRRWEARAA